MNEMPPIPQYELQTAKVLDTTFDKVVLTEVGVYARVFGGAWIQLKCHMEAEADGDDPQAGPELEDWAKT